MATLEPTKYFDQFLGYYERAAELQKINIASEHGRDTSEDLHVDDALQHYVTIYDTVDRRYAGFSNAIQQLWFGSENPKKWQADSSFDGLRGDLPPYEWFWIFLWHRLTGSGASFSHDHGFRNSVLADLATGHSIDVMRDEALSIMRSGKPVFTSIGNTIPMFPKPCAPFERASEYYVATFMNDLVMDLWTELEAHPREKSIREVVEWINNWHRARGLKCFHFQMTAWVMDIAEYFDYYIDQYSQVNYGKNAVEALNTLFIGHGFKNKQQFLDAAMDETARAVRSPMNEEDQQRGMAVPYSVEDVACDFIRYLGCYVPKGYEHLEPWQVTHSIETDYPKHWTYNLHVGKK